MKYQLINTVFTEQKIDEDSYLTTIVMGFSCTDGIGANFSKDIEITQLNTLTGYEVDSERQVAVDNYLIEINQ